MLFPVLMYILIRTHKQYVLEASVLGADAVDVAAYTIRGLLDLADMAASKGDRVTQQWADSHAAAMEQRFSGAWWLPGIPQFADSLELLATNST